MENEVNPTAPVESYSRPAPIAEDAEWKPGLRKRKPRTQQFTTRVDEDLFARFTALHEARRERFKNESFSRTIETAIRYFLADPLGESLRYKTR